MIHTEVGTLGTLDASYKIPVSAETIDITPILPTPVEMLWPLGLNTPQQYSVLIGWSLRHFYIESTAQPEPEELIGGMISYLNCVLPPQAVEGSGLLDGALEQCGIRPVWRVVTPENLQEFRTPETLRVFRLFNTEARRKFIRKRSQQIGLLGVILLLIGKSVTTAGYDGWMRNRLRTFRGVLGIGDDDFIWTVPNAPAQRILASLSTYLSASQKIRMRLFHVCFRAAAGRTGIATHIFSTVVKLLRGVEMNHILLIDYYLFTKYPEILRVRVVRDNMAKYNQALRYLMSVPEAERLYVKLLREKSETDVLNRNNFVMLSAAAKFENPSMKNYRGGQETAAGGHIDKIVTTYLTVRTNLAVSGIVKSSYAYLDVTEGRQVTQESEKLAKGRPEKNLELQLTAQMVMNSPDFLFDRL
jgi:hypothetical protein